MFSQYYGKRVFAKFQDTPRVEGVLERVTDKNVDGDRTITIASYTQGSHNMVTTLPGFRLYLDLTERTVRMMLYVMCKKAHVTTDVFVIIHSFLVNDYERIDL